MDANGPWRDDNISWPGGGGPRYDVVHPVTGQPCKVPERGWIWPDPETMREKIRLGIVVFRDDHTEPPFRKSHLRPIAGEEDAEDLQQETDDDVELAVQVRGTYFYKQSQASVKHLRGLMGAQVFNNPKDHVELSRLFEYVLGRKDGIVMDFFAGSGTTAEAVFDVCARTGLNCPVVLVQLPERLEDNLKSATGSSKTTIQNAIKLLERLGKPLNIAELTKIRIAKAGELIVANRQQSDWNGDVGFRAFTIDTSNFANVAMTPDAASQITLVDLVESVKADRESGDVIFEILIDWGLQLSSPIQVEEIEGHEVFSVDDDALLACLDDTLDDELIRVLAKRKPLKAVFKDTGFVSDAARINAEQVFEQLSPDTDVRVL